MKTIAPQTRYRYALILLRQLVITNFKLRYQGSVLGYLWTLLRPLMLFVILYIVFAQFLKLGDDVPHYPVYLLTGIVLWNFFAEVTNNSVTAIVDKGDMIRKINFPKYVIVLAAAFSAVINLILNAIVVGVFIVFTGSDININILLVPFLVLEIFVFAIGIALILSALFVRLRDVNYIWEVVMQALFYGTPIIYPVSVVIDKYPQVAHFLLLNPVAQAIQDIRYAVITPTTDTLASFAGPVWYVAPFSLVAAAMLIGLVYFKRRAAYFAELV